MKVRVLSYAECEFVEAVDRYNAKWPALFRDRNGVVKLNHGYACRPQGFKFIDGIFDLCQAAQRQG